MTRILLVSDDQSRRGGICEALAGEGYEIRCARDGRRGLAALAEEPTDLIIADWTTAAGDEVGADMRPEYERGRNEILPRLGELG